MYSQINICYRLRSEWLQHYVALSTSLRIELNTVLLCRAIWSQQPVCQSEIECRIYNWQLFKTVLKNNNKRFKGSLESSRPEVAQ